MGAPRVVIQTQDFDLSAEVAALRAGDARVGAVCTFVGTVRERNGPPTLPAAHGALPPGGADSPWGGPAANRAPPTLPAAHGALALQAAEPPEATPLRAVPTRIGEPGAAALSPQGADSPWGGPAANRGGSSVTAMELEHYPGMTEQAIEAMIDEAHRRFALYGVRVVHRVGRLAPQEQIVLVAVTSAHRGESFQACEFLMDYLKTQAPFWKKETTPEGARWVDARVSDDAALARWGIAARNA